jgi:hypothetical protein
MTRDTQEPYLAFLEKCHQYSKLGNDVRERENVAVIF